MGGSKRSNAELTRDSCTSGASAWYILLLIAGGKVPIYEKYQPICLRAILTPLRVP